MGYGSSFQNSDIRFPFDPFPISPSPPHPLSPNALMPPPTCPRFEGPYTVRTISLKGLILVEGEPPLDEVTRWKSYDEKEDQFEVGRGRWFTRVWVRVAGCGTGGLSKQGQGPCGCLWKGVGHWCSDGCAQPRRQ